MILETNQYSYRLQMKLGEDRRRETALLFFAIKARETRIRFTAAELYDCQVVDLER